MRVSDVDLVKGEGRGSSAEEAEGARDRETSGIETAAESFCSARCFPWERVRFNSALKVQD